MNDKQEKYIESRGIYTKQEKYRKAHNTEEVVKCLEADCGSISWLGVNGWDVGRLVDVCLLSEWPRGISCL